MMKDLPLSRVYQLLEAGPVGPTDDRPQGPRQRRDDCDNTGRCFIGGSVS